MVATASTGYCPAADSADSMMASAPSYTAVATSETSARVGTGLWIIDSSICVATTTGLPARRASRVICFCRLGTRSSGSSAPGSRGAAPDQLLGLVDILGALHERQRDPIDSGHQRRFEVGAIFRRHRGDRQV